MFVTVLYEKVQLDDNLPMRLIDLYFEKEEPAVETADTTPIVMLSVLALASAFVVCNELKKRKA